MSEYKTGCPQVTPNRKHRLSTCLVAIFLVVMRLKKVQEVSQVKQVNPLSKYPKLGDAEYRRAYLLASIEQGIAWQIKTNRTARALSQADLADALGVEQSAVSQLEDPAYGGHTVDTLIKLAEAFDCALSLEFVPFSALARDGRDLSPQALYAAPYSEEILNS